MAKDLRKDAFPAGGPQEIVVKPPFIRLDAFLKLCGSAGTGGEAKVRIQQGGVLVNGEVCTQRGKKLVGGDAVQDENGAWIVEME